MTDVSEVALIEAFQSGGSEMEHAVRYLHQREDWRTSAFATVKKTGGSIADGEMVLHDGLLILAMNVRKGKFKADSSLKTYFSGICRNVWYSMLKKKGQTVPLNSIQNREPTTTLSVETDFMKNEQQDILNEVLESLGEDCKSVLGMWALNYSFAEISEKLGISEGAARKRKYDCLKKLTRLLKDRPWLVDEILNEE